MNSKELLEKVCVMNRKQSTEKICIMNNKYRVGVIGCGGVVGKKICDYLKSEHILIIGGQRSEPDYNDFGDDFIWKKLDINIENQIREFVNECELIVNCAGTAYINAKKIASIVGELGKVYIDVSDALAFDEKTVLELESKGAFYIAAGYYPGITGALLNKVINEFELVEDVVAYSGGNELFSVFSCLDIIMSGESPMCLNGCYIENAKPVKENLELEKTYDETVKREIYKKLFISNEIYSVIREYPITKINKLKWYDITDDNYLALLAMKYYQIRDSMDFDDMYKELSKYIKRFNKNIDEWSLLRIEATGMVNDEYKTVCVQVNLENTMDITAFAVARVVKSIIRDGYKKGIHWSYKFIPNNILELYDANRKEKSGLFEYTYDETYEL